MSVCEWSRTASKVSLLVTIPTIIVAIYGYCFCFSVVRTHDRDLGPCPDYKTRSGSRRSLMAIWEWWKPGVRKSQLAARHLPPIRALIMLPWKVYIRTLRFQQMGTSSHVMYQSHLPFRPTSCTPDKDADTRITKPRLALTPLRQPPEKWPKRGQAGQSYGRVDYVGTILAGGAPRILHNGISTFTGRLGPPLSEAFPFCFVACGRVPAV
jgi:hypothetical protein